MQRRDFLRTAGLAAGSGALAGCLGRDGETGLLVTRFSDASGPIDEFASCVVTIRALRVLSAHAATETEEHEGAELLFSVEDVSVDLVEAAADDSVYAFEQALRPDEYVYLKLAVGTIQATLGDGREAVVETPDDDPLTFPRPFEIRTGQATTLTADVALVQRGSSTSYLLRPKPATTTVSYD